MGYFIDHLPKSKLYYKGYIAYVASEVERALTYLAYLIPDRVQAIWPAVCVAVGEWFKLPGLSFSNYP